jgi:hypothetical protein
MPEIVKNVKEDIEVVEDEVDTEDEVFEEDDSVPENPVIMPEDLPEDAIIFEGGPTAGQIVEWKKEYGDVYITEISYDRYVVWRTIYRGEYKNLVQQINQMMDSGKFNEIEINMFNEETICGLCVLFPQYTQEELDKELAGMPSIISQMILENSGFRPIDTRQL